MGNLTFTKDEAEVVEEAILFALEYEEMSEGVRARLCSARSKLSNLIESIIFRCVRCGSKLDENGKCDCCDYDGTKMSQCIPMK